jgi:hypothetical protein
LQIVASGNVRPLVPGAVFVFDRIRRAIGQELDDIGLANQPEAVAEQGLCPLNPQTVTYLKTGIIHPLVQGLAALGKEVFFKHLLDVDQGALAWTVSPVLESRERDRVERFGGHLLNPCVDLATCMG